VVVCGGSGSSDGDVTNAHGSMDMWVAMLDTSGTLLWEKAIGGSLSETAFAMIDAQDGGVVLAGSTSSTDGDVTDVQGGADVWAVKLEPLATVVERAATRDALSLVPNPAADQVCVTLLGASAGPFTLTVSNAFGAAVMQHASASAMAKVDVSVWPAGCYTFTLRDARNIYTRLLVVE
jgi:hypothetical protein